MSVLLAKTLRSATFKLALVSIGLFGAVMVALFGYVYWSATTLVLSQTDSTIEAELASLRNTYDSAGRDGLVRAIEQRVTETRIASGLYQLADASFVPIAGNLKKLPAGTNGTQGWTEFRADALNPTAPGEQSLFRARWERLPGGFHLLVGRAIGDVDRFTNEMYAALAFAIGFIFVLAAVASVSVTRRTVGRIDSINTTSRAIMDSGLGKRIPLRGTQDEWDHLAQNLNSMLERIEGLMGEVKEVSDNVAHDLRTPLTRMRGRLEKASIGQRNPEHDQALIGDTIADLDDVLRIFSSLTRISQIETADRSAAFRAVDLVEIAEAVVELFDAVAEAKDVRLKVAGDRTVAITGDRDLLFDAIANLVDNAIKHGREAGQVTVEVTLNDSCAVIAISDDGPGIPAGEHQHVFRRFYRLERSRCTPGNGLGLSLVAAVASLHKARITLVDNAPGLKVELLLPLVEDSLDGNSTL